MVSSKELPAEELEEKLVLEWLGTSVQLTLIPIMEEFIKVAISVMFSAMTIKQKSPQKHAIMDDLSPFQHQSSGCFMTQYCPIQWS